MLDNLANVDDVKIEDSLLDKNARAVPGSLDDLVDDAVESGESEACEEELEDFASAAEDALKELEDEEQNGEYACRLPTHVRVEFKDRTWGNKILYVVYKIFRTVLVSVWFYFVPFVAMFASYVIPAYLQG